MYDKSNKVIGNLVVVQHDNVEKALRKFKKKVAESGLLQNLRERETYEKPTTTEKKPKQQLDDVGRKNSPTSSYLKNCTDVYRIPFAVWCRWRGRWLCSYAYQY
jgi:ribosomal protein S21